LGSVGFVSLDPYKDTSFLLDDPDIDNPFSLSRMVSFADIMIGYTVEPTNMKDPRLRLQDPDSPSPLRVLLAAVIAAVFVAG
jgi:hypothetical protein